MHVPLPSTLHRALAHSGHSVKAGGEEEYRAWATILDVICLNALGGRSRAHMVVKVVLQTEDTLPVFSPCQLVWAVRSIQTHM